MEALLDFDHGQLIVQLQRSQPDLANRLRQTLVCVESKQRQAARTFCLWRTIFFFFFSPSIHPDLYGSFTALRMVLPKTEPPGSPDKGKGRQLEQDDAGGGDLEPSMADWIPDPALWEKMGMGKDGAGTSMNALAAPVKTIEVCL